VSPPLARCNAEARQNVPGRLWVRPFVVSVTVTSVKTTVIGGPGTWRRASQRGDVRGSPSAAA
jgi:hypothetical protein